MECHRPVFDIVIETKSICVFLNSIFLKCMVIATYVVAVFEKFNSSTIFAFDTEIFEKNENILFAFHF